MDFLSEWWNSHVPALQFFYVVAIVSLFAFLSQSAGNISFENTIGKIATVYVTIQSRGAQGGQVELVVEGRLRFVDAVRESGEPITVGTKVRVTSVVDVGTLKVEKLG